MKLATWTKSSSFKPRDVSAGVPTDTPINYTSVNIYLLTSNLSRYCFMNETTGVHYLGELWKEVGYHRRGGPLEI